MKRWLRVVGLASVFALVGYANAGAQFPIYGSCFGDCDGVRYELTYVTAGQCCFNLNHFGACYTTGTEWHPYGEGDSLFCGG